MTLSEVYKRLLTTGFPVAYRDFTAELSGIPEPPFIVYRVLSEEFDGGDIRRFIKESLIDVELYTKGKDLAAEELVDGVLLDFADIEKYESAVDEGFTLVRYTFTIREFLKGR